MQRHAGEGMEKGLLMELLDAEGAPVLMIGAMEGLLLQNAVCCVAVHTNGLLKHLMCLMSACSREELMPSICEDAFCYPTTDIMAKLSHQFRQMTN